MKMQRWLPWWSLFFVSIISLLAAPKRCHAVEPGEELTVYVLTFGPGDHPFFKFGHNAIWVHDGTQHTDAVYNFGTFLFDSPMLIPVFLKGKLRYWLSVQSLRGTIAAYEQENRSIEAQELNLIPAQRRKLADRLTWNARDENKYYKYDYYQDNCSTRIRDAVDAVVGGRIRDATHEPASMSWRAHTQRLTADDIPVYLGLYIAMGDFIDKPIDVWEEMFLPPKVQESLRRVKIAGPQGDVPLVKSERVLLSDQRTPPRQGPPHWVAPMALVGSLLGAGFAMLGHFSTRRRAIRILFGIGLSLMGLLLGLLGNIFVMFWLLTDHVVAHHNENILQCAPWAIVLTWAGLGLARGRPRALRIAHWVTLAAAISALLGLMLKALPWFDQGNSQIIALLLPFWVGATYGVHRAYAGHGDGPRPQTLLLQDKAITPRYEGSSFSVGPTGSAEGSSKASGNGFSRGCCRGDLRRVGGSSVESGDSWGCGSSVGSPGWEPWRLFRIVYSVIILLFLLDCSVLPNAALLRGSDLVGGSGGAPTDGRA